jgi:nucleoside-triphosphatase THEP1
MPIIDNIKLDDTNVEFNNAVELVKFPPNPIIYLTGKAGTGKTTFLKYIKETSEKNTVVVAYTGVAAVNAGGQTINSFFQIPPQSIFSPKDARLRTKSDQNDTDKSTIYDHFQYSKQKRITLEVLEVLIIDEISMVRCDLLDVIDNLLRAFSKRKPLAPFGGVQVLLIGDTFQLPPITRVPEWEILSQFYDSPFFFSSNVIKQNRPIYIELKKIYRQKEQDFISLLDRVRVNQVTPNDLQLLNSRYNPTFIPNLDSEYITLASHNHIVDTINQTKLNELPSEPTPFNAMVTGTFPQNIMPTKEVLLLKEGAQVMFIKNNWIRGYYNGKIGKVQKLEENRIIVKFYDNTYKEDKEIQLDCETWKNIKYVWNSETKKIEEEILGTFTQFPLRLAWAITVNKSQGLTFENVIADVGAAFAHGQVYVALSRCTTFNGLVLKSRIERNVIITDQRVIEFARQETPTTLLVQQLNESKADFHYKKCREVIKHGNISEAYYSLMEAIKYRDDTKTETFRRFFNLFLTKLHLQKDILQANTTEIREDIATIEEQKSTINELNQKGNQQNQALKLLIDKVKNLETELESKNSTIASLTTTKDKLLIDLKNLQSNINSKDNIIKGQDQEIDRLKNLKWYQRLFGQK